MKFRRILSTSSMGSIAMVMLVALLTMPAAARQTASTVEANASATADLAVFVVGDGSPASCTKEAIQYELWAALAAGGGRVFFNCGLAPVTIPISSGDPLTFFDNTTIDGGGRITLQAALDHRPSLVVDGEATVVMRNLAFVGGGINRDGIDNAGNLTVSECTFSRFQRPAISSGSSLTIIQSTFSDNAANQGVPSPVVIRSGTGSVRRSTFSSSQDGRPAGAITNDGTLDIASSRFIGNHAAEGTSGAIYNTGVLTVENSEFTGNTAYFVGAVWNEGSLLVTNSTFSNNNGRTGVGAIAGSGSMTIRGCDFLNNTGGSDGGALLLLASGRNVTIANSTFSGNHAARGGGIFSSADSLTLRRSIILGNTAGRDGGGIFVAGGSLVQDRDTIIDNLPNDVISAAPSISSAAPTGTVDRPR